MEKNEYTEKFRTVLRKAGLKATSARLAVCEILARAKTPLSPQEMIERAAGRMDQATVYRMVGTLAHAGIIRQVDLRHNHAHYELVGSGDHHHVVCIGCGRVEDISGCDLGAAEAAIRSSTRHFAEIHQHALEFYGLCIACAKKRDGNDE